jgi:PKD repeat protein
MAPVFCGAMLLGTARRASASTLTVSNTLDGPPASPPAGSLRAAVQGAVSGDTIDLTGVTGTITLTNGQLITNATLSITGPGATALAVSGGNASRVFVLYGGATISGLTITQGNGSRGGAILSGGNLTLTGCDITQSNSYLYGAIYGGALTMQNCTITGNTGTFGCVVAGGYATITNCTFSGNTGFHTLSIGYTGGNIKGSTLSNNTGDGAYARPKGKTCTFDSCTFSGNTSSGLFSRPINLAGVPGSVILENCTVYGNQSGVVAKSGGVATLNIRNSTISGNTNGGINIPGGYVVYLSSTIVAGNTPADITGNGISGTPDHNLVGVGTGGITNGVNGNITGASPLLGTLANNGGPTQTMALLIGSPAIDAGVANGLTLDQRGLPRSMGGGVDIGAYERDTVLPTAALGTAPNVNNASNPNTYTFTVVFSDNIAVDASSIGNANILVTGPGGFSQFATLVSVSPPGNGTPLTATYMFTAPGGLWAPTANGTYTITMQPNQVLDTTGNAVAAGALGTFSVAVLQFTAAVSASPNPQLIGQPIQFGAAAAGVGPLTYTWDFGDGTTGTGSSISHVYPVKGAYTVVLTVTDGNGQTITATLVANAVPLVFTSGPSATPNPISPNQVVQFAAVANGAQPVVYDWNFGDGTTGSGTNPSHVYAAPGTYVVTVVATDANGLKVSSTLTINVLDLSVDSDGDGFTNDVEFALGTDPLSAASTPFNLAKPTSAAALTAKKLKIQLNFNVVNSDYISLTGTLPIPSGFVPLNQILIFNIDHVVKAFQLDKHGFASNSNGKTGLLNDSFKLQARRGNFTLKLARGAFQAALASDSDPARQLTAVQGASKTRTVKVTIYFNNTVFSGDISGPYKAPKGKFGK